MSRKFVEYFAEVQHFSNNTLVVRGNITKEEAAEYFSDYTGDPVEVEHIYADVVRYGYAPENVEDLAGQSCWYTGAKPGKGSKQVWVLDQ